jgi:hypothetical protein
MNWPLLVDHLHFAMGDSYVTGLVLFVGGGFPLT